eukprot:TRINITY_DN31003_c0_g1_i1.p1 TRINITY_DN31003_c0_g1~~TRINITY_DN31003_c0_g1_i1.p1  ORF type:complete len:381 (+),score=67.12 TRINITY_DN31003_c0_g1_i1:72-1214(+)
MADACSPSLILRSRAGGGIYDVNFTGAARLLSGGVEGEVSVWNLEDRRPAVTWSASDFSLLSVRGLDQGSSCLSQSKDGQLKLWDLETQKGLWQVDTDSCAFARCIALPFQGGDSLDVLPSSCWFCTPMAEASEVGVFDCRTPGQIPQECAVLALGRSAKTQAVKPGSQPISLGMCMALCAVPAFGPSFLSATYESTDTCLWDLRQPKEPFLQSCLAGDPSNPAISAAVLWKRIWVASAGGQIDVVKLRSSGIECASASVKISAAPHLADEMQRVQERKEEVKTSWQAEKKGVNALAVRPDLRLVAAARWDKRVELFDGKTSSSLGRLQCHDGGVLCVSFDRDRGALAAGGEDGRIAIWGVLSETYNGPATGVQKNKEDS